jgi:hypothetical protein
MALEAPVMAPEGAPRVGPALSPYTVAQEASEAAHAVGLFLRPWQGYGLDVMLSVDEDWQFIYREVAIIAARQNGKSKILIPRIRWALEQGRRILHTAQNRDIPRNLFLELAAGYQAGEARIRYANGQESIYTENGGSYKIIAPQRGARGESADDLIIDELREMEDFDFIAAAEPTLTESENPQVIYLSNAGTEASVVLNDLKARADTDPNLAYMEWSADPERAVDDRDGWLEANPAIGYSELTLDRLDKLYRKYRDANELSIFETEHLCRWVKSMAPRLVADIHWQRARGTVTWPPTVPAMGISVDADGKRASAAVAWQQGDGSIGLTLAADVHGDPINLVTFAVMLEEKAAEFGVHTIGFDPWTDQGLARHFQNTRKINGSEFANASERFVRLVELGGLVHQWAEKISEELPYASRRTTSGNSWMADRAGDRSITSVLAAVRAVWLASNPNMGKAALY